MQKQYDNVILELTVRNHPGVMTHVCGLFAWIVFGLIAGVIAKFIMPGRDGGGFILTCVLGVVGAVVGGWLATMFGIGGSVSGFNLHSFLVAVVGAILVLGIFRLLRRA
jgi:uncharacterized membrane protein YeaQ/YmgE (transglycosylase-associated protein family)